MPRAKKKKDDAPATFPDHLDTSPLSSSVSETEIARRAYDLYLQRNCGHGQDLADWFLAEHELRSSS